MTAMKGQHQGDGDAMAFQLKMIGICGGVGPAAGILLHQLLLTHTANNGTDQGHLHVCHFSCSADVADRTTFLKAIVQGRAADNNCSGKTVPENPAIGMAQTMAMVQASAQTSKRWIVAGIPCITFHVPAIWDEFQRLIHEHQLTGQVHCLHMLNETVRHLQDRTPDARMVGLMSTSGTRASRVFQELLEPQGYTVVQVPDELQEELQETIMNPLWGIKSTAPRINSQCVANFHRYAQWLIKQGAEALILGCTEIPFAFAGAHEFEGAVLIDPLVALARALIREVDPTRLVPLEALDLSTASSI